MNKFEKSSTAKVSNNHIVLRQFTLYAFVFNKKKNKKNHDRLGKIQKEHTTQDGFNRRLRVI